MAISLNEKCDTIHHIHVDGDSFRKTADKVGISLTGVSTVKEEFCKASGLKLVGRDNGSGYFFGGTSLLLTALDFQQESITRILDILLRERISKPDHNRWLLEVHEIFFEEVGLSSNWVRKALFQLVLESMKRELDRDANWHPYGEGRAADLSRFEEGGDYFWLVERAREKPRSKLKEFLNYSITTKQKGGKSTSTIDKQLHDAGFRKDKGMWVEYPISAGSGSGPEIFQTDETEEHFAGSNIHAGESDETTGMTLNVDELTDAQEKQYQDSPAEVMKGADSGSPHGLRNSFMAEALREEAKKFRNKKKGLRLLAVGELFDGKEIAEVAKTFAYEKKTLKKWLKNFIEFGIDGLSDKGNPGRPRKLTDEEWAKVEEIVVAGPDIVKDNRMIWRLCDIAEKIDDITGEMNKLSISAISKNLHRLEFRPLMPRPRHPKQNKKQIAKFKRIFPRLVKSVREEYQHKDNIEVWFTDEARFGQKNGMLPEWSKLGNRPTAPANAGYLNTHLLGAVCPVNRKCAALESSHVNTEVQGMLLTLISRAVARNAQAIVIMDRAAWHTTEMLKIPKNISLVHLPAYCPELNPIEIVWAYLKRTYFANRLFTSKQEIEEAVCIAWNAFRNDRDRIHSIFNKAMVWSSVAN